MLEHKLAHGVGQLMDAQTNWWQKTAYNPNKLAHTLGLCSTKSPKSDAQYNFNPHSPTNQNTYIGGIALPQPVAE